MSPTLPDSLVSLPGKVIRKLELSGARRFGALIAGEGLGVLVSVNANQEFCPNSTQKLFTAGAALLELRPDYRFRTELRARGSLTEDGTFNGDLILIASGDPTLTNSHISDLSTAVAEAGVRRVLGSLAIDDSRYDRLPDAPGWKSQFIPRFTGPLSALALDRNQWRSDREFLGNSTEANALRIVEALSGRGIHIEKSAKTTQAASKGKLLWVHSSPPISDIVSGMLKESDNFVAEQLLKELGAKEGQGTTSGGLRVLDRVAARLGVPPAPYSTDGSGLSPLNRDTPGRQVRWLKAIETSEVGRQFCACLPALAPDGKTNDRFADVPVGTRFFAKTGSRPFDASANLAGYGDVAGRRFWFSLMVSEAKSVAGARRAIDKALIATVRSDWP